MRSEGGSSEGREGERGREREEEKGLSKSRSDHYFTRCERESLFSSRHHLRPTTASNSTILAY